MEKEKLVIIDGHALIHRAYHAIPPLTTKNGEIVNAVYGFAVILLNVLRDLDPKYIAVAFDLPGKTKRHDDYADYKATRKAAPDDLKSQISRVRKLVESFNIPVIDKVGYEADDVIGTIVKNSPAKLENYIVTGDLDELQLVDSRTRVYTMRKGFSDVVIYDEAKVIERYGINPSQFIDYKALRGDPSDNIPGVSGIGEKTATNLIKEFGSLENIYQNLDKIKPAIANKLQKDKEMAYLSQKLSTIETNLKLGFDITKCKTADFNREKLLNELSELGFKSLLSKIPTANSPEKFEKEEFKAGDYQKINNTSNLKKLIEKIQKLKLIAFDLNLSTTNVTDVSLLGISISTEPEKGHYFSFKDSGDDKSEKIKSYIS
jgi:DNA polymerase I